MTPHLLLSYDFPPMGGGIARMMGELVRRYPADGLMVSTGNHPDAPDVDNHMGSRVDRLALPSRRLRTVQGLASWTYRADALTRSIHPGFVWCGNFKPAMYPARWIHAHRNTLRDYALRHRIAAVAGPDALLRTQTLCCPDTTRVGCSLARDQSLYSPPRPGSSIDTGLRVLALLRNEFPDLRYAVVGSGANLAEYQELARTLGVEQRVRFLTAVPDSDLPGLYNSAEIYMGVSRPVELMIAGFGISLSEAAACGLPVIGGQSGGIPDAVRDGETGLLVDATPADAVADAVRLLLRDRDLAQRLGVGGRKAVESFFNWDRVTQDVFGIAEEYALR